MISINDLSKRFRRTEVLRGVNLSINRGERIALIGANGAGKTTLIRCLLGEYVHDGSVMIDGKSPRLAREEVLARVGFVPQISPPLKMPVAQLMKFAANVCNSEVSKMRDVAARLGLDTERVANQPFVKLSGGQKQKILICIALGRSADLLILDEPSANLDPDARHHLFQLLAERQEHAVMLISSHRLDEVAALVNRVIEMDQGLITLDDKVADSMDMSSTLHCQLELSRDEPAFAKAIAEWGFAGDGLSWQGKVAAPDRLRFLGVLSRYAGALSAIEMRENS
ncbi:MAG: ABC transporter ATP-binding protein [Thiohalomonadaceae bacterium]